MDFIQDFLLELLYLIALIRDSNESIFRGKKHNNYVSGLETSTINWVILKNDCGSIISEVNVLHFKHSLIDYLKPNVQRNARALLISCNVSFAIWYPIFPK